MFAVVLATSLTYLTSLNSELLYRVYFLKINDLTREISSRNVNLQGDLTYD
uniref:Uncharacterized protein n=1 Tax=Arundo donax TaxID=35708 RepID=A0A0A9BSQ7_ARUDO